MRRRLTIILTALICLGAFLTPAQAHGGYGHGGYGQAGHSLRAPETRENFYFVMADRFANGSTTNDTGGLPDDPMISGFDPTRTGFYNGGDLAGLAGQLDYIQGLGTTAIWLTPSFKNKAVQPEDNSAGYHGYWVTDFTQIDPHLGTNDELKSLIDDAHARGMKVYFDIITNHTADVIGYQQGARMPYISKDQSPYLTAGGDPFDDRDYAGGADFPALDPTISFPYTPVLEPGEDDLKVPAWLNDVTLYHNRGDTTFAGENSQYGDFFGLDDLFTENPAVVQGMIEVYQTWIADFGIDGFRIDTMKHVDDRFWQRFGPEVLAFAHEHGKQEFFMFGEVFDTSAPFTSSYTTRNKMQAVLDFPFQQAARSYASQSGSAADLEAFFAGDDWYTDADSNAYQLPTFLGNHDMGRIGWMVQTDNPGAGDEQWLARDRLAHELMYFSRGNPVIYYGDEQGFTGSGGDQVARQTLFTSQVPEYLDDDLIGTDSTHAGDNYDRSHPLYTDIAALAALTAAHPALRDGAQQSRYAGAGPGIFAFSRTDARAQREYLVAVNNSGTAQTAEVQVYAADRNYRLIYGEGPGKIYSSGRATLRITVPAMSSVVYRMDGRVPTSAHAPRITLATPTPSDQDTGRTLLEATVAGHSFYEVTFQSRLPGGRWTTVGTDDNAPYRVYADTTALASGQPVQYRAIVLDNAGHRRAGAPRWARVPAPTLTVTTPVEGSRVRGVLAVQAVASPERADHVVEFDRRLPGAEWVQVGTDASSPTYTLYDDVDALGLAPGTQVQYRARLIGADGARVTSAITTVTLAGPPLAVTTLNYRRPAGDYADWGLHLWGDGIEPATLAGIDWNTPMPPTRIVDGWAQFDIALTSDTEAVNFIIHTPGGDTVPTTREPGGDRSFVPVDAAQVWIVQGDPTVHTSRP